MAYTATDVKNLRERTGAGMMDCKSALVESKGSMDGAQEIIRKKGLAKVNKRVGKVAAEGTLGLYIHAGDQVAAMVELNCETDFVARGEEFRNLAKSIAMQAAAMRPEYLSIESVPEAVITKEKEIALAQLAPGQREKADKILPGKLQKFYEEKVLLCQIYVKDEAGKATIQDMLNELSMKCGEKVSVRRFQVFEVGEGITKAETNLAEEVAATIAAQG